MSRLSVTIPGEYVYEYGDTDFVDIEVRLDRTDDGEEQTDFRLEVPKAEEDRDPEKGPEKVNLLFKASELDAARVFLRSQEDES